MNRRPRLVLGTLTMVMAIAGCSPAAPPKATPVVVPTTRPVPTTTVPVPITVPGTPMAIMGASRYTAGELTAWYKSKGKVQAEGSCATVSQLAAFYISEGAIENVRGDLAFVQAMIETGWLKHSERVPASYCNYAGIGAVDSGTGANVFENANIGVRAQIHHLRAYADKTANCSNFKFPNASPRCSLVLPKGKSPTWNQMGNGNWATDPGYATKVLNLYGDLKAFTGR